MEMVGLHLLPDLDKFNSERRLNDFATSPPANELHVPAECSSSLKPSESDQLSPGAPTHITGTMASTRPTDFGLATIPMQLPKNGEANLNTPLKPSYVLRDGSLKVGTNSVSDADGGSSLTGGTPEQRASFDGPAMRSVEAFSRLQATRGSDLRTSSPALCTSAPPSDCHGVNPDLNPNSRSSFSFRSLAAPLLHIFPWKFNVTSIKSFREAAHLFMCDILPRQLYHNLLLLGLPTMYSKLANADVERIEQSFQDRVGVESAREIPYHGGCSKEFMDSLLKHWTVVKAISTVLILAILTVLQMPGAANDPITRSTALHSLICALMSLLYGGIFIMGSETMRVYWNSKWAQEVRKANTVVLWNIWVFLAMPVAWMSWSGLLFLATILSFVWRTKPGNDPSFGPSFSAKAIWGSRVAIMGVLMLGFAYLVMILKTLMRYGLEDVDPELGTSSDPVSELGGRVRDGDRMRDGEMSTLRQRDCRVGERLSVM